MCLIVFAWQAHPHYRLVLAGNRDEFHARPSAPLAWWPDVPDVAGGRDLQAGGTWLAIRRDGRLGAVTNYRDPAALRPDGPSRGGLVADFLAARHGAFDYARAVAERGGAMSGFNLLVADDAELAYAVNRPEPHAVRIDPGIYGLSNHRLDTPWPKLVTARASLAAALAAQDPDPEDLFALLAGRDPAPDAALPDTGVGLELERLLSPRFIVSPGYGTRSSSVLLVTHAGEGHFEERRYDPAGRECGRTRLRLSGPPAVARAR